MFYTLFVKDAYAKKPRNEYFTGNRTSALENRESVENKSRECRDPYGVVRKGRYGTEI